jgi:hypothetical protein
MEVAAAKESSEGEFLPYLQIPHYVDTVRCGFASSQEEGSSGNCVSRVRERRMARGHGVTENWHVVVNVFFMKVRLYP